MDNAEILHLRQGSPEWHAHRKAHFNASDAAAMLGISPHMTRTQLLDRMASGIAPEIDETTQRRFDKGHEYEAMARPWAEEMLGEDLFPVVAAREVDGLPLSASYDGVTLDHGIVWEHKMLTAELAAALDAGEIPEFHCVQLEQELLILGAQRTLFMASAGNEDDARHAWYRSRSDLRAKLLAGWAQFREDLRTHVVAIPAAPRPEGRAPETLPALLIEVTGAVTASNLTEFREHAVAVFRSINRDLQTDQDFADAERTVKWCDEVEQRLRAAKQHALAQTASIDALFRAIDEIAEEARRTRLDLDKMVKHRKETIRAAIVHEAMDRLKAHIEALNTRLGRAWMPPIQADFGGAIKSKRTIDSLRGAVADELARAKIAANEIADRIQLNLNWLREHAAEHAALFADAQALVLNTPEAMQAIAQQRIAEHQRREAAREEALRARIRAEEEARAKAQAEAAARAAAVPAAPPPAAPIAPAAPVMVPVVPRAEEAHTLTLGRVGIALGFTVSAELLERLGFECRRVRGVQCVQPSMFTAICHRLADHVLAVGERGLP